jgi:phosphate-selective porin OprO/OprP
VIASRLLVLLMQPADAGEEESRATDPAAPTEVVAPTDATPEEPPPEEPPPEEPPPEEPPPEEPAPEDDPPAGPDAAVADPEAAPANPKTDPTPISATRFVPGKGFELASKDGRFSLLIRARIQARYELLHPNLDGENTEHSFSIRRMRLQFQGNVFGKHNRYYIQLGISDPDMSRGMLADEDGEIRRNPIRDARIEFDYLRDLTVWVGQMKVPFSRQRVVSSGNLNMVDRSLINEEFQLDRDLGIQLLSKDIGGKGWFAYNAGVFMGEGRNQWEPRDFGMLYVARFEITPMGKFEDYSEGDVERTETPKLSLGVAYAFNDDARGVHGTWDVRFADQGTADFHNVGADAMFKWMGLSFQTAFHWRRVVDRESGGALDEMGMPVPLELGQSGLGWFGQLGYLVPKIDLEVVARYALVRNVFGDASALGFRDEAGGGINYYFAGHNLKLQLDYFRMWGLEEGPAYDDALQRGTDRIRLQLQLAF